MKTKLTLTILLVLILTSSCTDQKAAERQAKEEAEAKMRAEAARKEMETLPKTFQTRDYFKKNAPASGTTAPTSKPTTMPP